MPKTIPVPPPEETPRGPQPTPGVPDRAQDKPATPPVIDEGDRKDEGEWKDKGDRKKPKDPRLDPALLPIGDPAGMA